MRYILLLIIGLGLTMSVVAQDTPVIQTIVLNTPVEETITDEAFFDWWRINLLEGDVIVAEMVAEDGLVPLLGLLSPGGDLVARSDVERVAEVNGKVALEFRAETEGQYTLVPTRDANQEGTSTGSYILTVRNPNAAQNTRENLYAPAQFRCNELIINTAIILEFEDDVRIDENVTDDTLVELYRLTVYGMDGFHPVILAEADIQEGRLDCTDDGQSTVDNTYILPDGTEGVVAEYDLDQTAQLTLRNIGGASTFGSISLTLGALEGTNGRYMLVLEGLSLQDRLDIDVLDVRLGPLAKENPVQVYMVGNMNNRLDPFLEWARLEDEVRCDDAGRGDCEDMLPFTGAGTTILAGEGTTIVGDRFDAGLLLNPNDSERQLIELSSRDGNTQGAYTIVIIGEMPVNE